MKVRPADREHGTSYRPIRIYYMKCVEMDHSDKIGRDFNADIDEKTILTKFKNNHILTPKIIFFSYWPIPLDYGHRRNNKL